MWRELSYNFYNYDMSDRFNIETEFDIEFENIYTDKDIVVDDEEI